MQENQNTKGAKHEEELSKKGQGSEGKNILYCLLPFLVIKFKIQGYDNYNYN